MSAGDDLSGRHGSHEDTKARRVFTLRQRSFLPIEVRLGELGWLEQKDSLIVIEREHALELADRLAAWALGAEPPAFVSSCEPLEGRG